MKVVVDKKSLEDAVLDAYWTADIDLGLDGLPPPLNITDVNTSLRLHQNGTTDMTVEYLQDALGAAVVDATTDCTFSEGRFIFNIGDSNG